jgi:hypothetical protein
MIRDREGADFRLQPTVVDVLSYVIDQKWSQTPENHAPCAGNAANAQGKRHYDRKMESKH